MTEEEFKNIEHCYIPRAWWNELKERLNANNFGYINATAVLAAMKEIEGKANDKS